ncbi:GSCOCG00013268001-RA-CDS [Cotesia congregata]|nr:GSCOCG00013268001-RA-CDS [Cotesia congregata]
MATNAPRINEKKLSDDEYSALCEIKYLRSTLSFLQKRVRRKARVQYPYYLMYEEIIGKLPKYAENSSEFPVHLQFEGIWDDPEDTHDRQTLHPIQYYKKKIRTLEEQYISKLDELMDNQGQLANEVKKALRRTIFLEKLILMTSGWRNFPRRTKLPGTSMILINLRSRFLINCQIDLS